MSNTDVTIVIHDEDEFREELRKHLIANNHGLDETVENWLDSEFNRIYVTYAYADVTNIN
jgi:hypothetical protein